MTLWLSTLVHLGLGVGGALAVWAWYRRTGNAAWIDAVWAALIGAGALLHGAFGATTPAAWGLSLLMAAWSLRLSAHLFHRVATEPEDGRYEALRERWILRHGEAAVPGRFLVFYLLQAVLATALAVPAGLVAFDRAAAFGPWQILSLALGAVSLAGAHLSDRQLARFRADPANRGRTCREGLWARSRHPNYFFEILLWTAFALYAVPSPGGLWAWIAPASIAFFLLKVTGIPLTEAQALRRRGDDYRHYMRTTSALVPWFRPKENTP